MENLMRVEISILKALRKQDEKGELQNFVSEIQNLEEHDPIQKVREIVHHVERLIDLNYVEAQEDFYAKSDHVSFKYVNTAVELYPEKLNITDDGMLELNRYEITRETPVTEKTWFVWLTYLITFGLGMLTMHLLK